MKRPTTSQLILSFTLLFALCLFELWLYTFVERQKYIKVIRTHLYLFIEFLNILSIRYIWKRLNVVIKTKSIIAPGFIFKALIFVVLLVSLVTMVVVMLPVSSDPHILTYVCSFCSGAVVFLTTCLGISDMVSYAIRKTCRPTGARPTEMDRNEIKIRTYLALLCAAFLVGYGAIGVNEITIKHIQLPMKGLDSSMNGTKVVQLSDIHLGPFTGKRVLENIVGMVNSLQPDVVVITGDMVDSSFESLKEAITPLRKLETTHGVYFSTGNHEYYTGDVDSWIHSLPSFNVTPLINSRVCLSRSHDPSHKSCDQGVYLAGLEDIESRKVRYGSHSMDLHAALSGRTNGIPTIVLAHQPWAAVEAIFWDDVRLVLSGHTHGGQLFPMAPLVYFYNPFYAGLYQPLPDVYVHVNPGSFYYLFPFRHYYKPEITEITIVRSS